MYLAATIVVVSIIMRGVVPLNRENKTECTYIVTHPHLTGNINKVLFLLTTPSINLLTVVIATYEPNMSFRIEDTTINRYLPATIEKPSMMNEHSEMTTCYNFNGSKFFSLSVVLMESSVSMASYTAVPVAMWHTQYYIVVPRYSPIIQIVAHTTVVLNFVPRFQNADYRYTFQSKTISSGDDIVIKLQRNQAFLMKFCDKSEYVSISGSFIKSSETIGVIISNCRLVSAIAQCSDLSVTHDPERWTNDITAEMILGTSYYGMTFITLPMHNSKLTGEYLILAQQLSTNVIISQDTKSVRHTELKHKGDWTTVGISRQPIRIASDKPIQVLLVLQSSCYNITNDGWTDMSSTSIITPTNMFFTRYFWMRWSYKDMDVTFHLMLVVRSSHVQFIYLDNRRVLQSSIQWSVVDGDDKWKVGVLAVSGTAHDLFEMTHSPIGCYLHVESDGTTTMNNVGLATPTCELSIFSDVPNDGIDNDCDNMIDEEEQNGIDDDNDLRVDEDLNEKKTDVVNVAPRHTKNNCSNGMFGEVCKFICRCDDGICDGDGDCLTTTRCLPGWFATACQYRDMATQVELDNNLLNDNDDTTCIKVTSRRITLKLKESYLFTWIRIVFGSNDPVSDVTLTFTEPDSTRPQEVMQCLKSKTFQISSRVMDVYCLEVYLKVISVTVIWQGNNLVCSFHMSGGRNVALHKTSISHRSLPPRQGENSPADEVVNGRYTQNMQGHLDQGQFIAVDILFSPTKFIQSLHIYLGESEPGSELLLEFLDEYENLQFSTHVTLGKGVVVVVNDKSHLYVAIARIHLIKGSVFLNELEAYGDCAPPFYGLGCDSFCGLHCLNEMCTPEGSCFRCHPKKSGRFCRDVVFQNQFLEDDRDNNTVEEAKGRQIEIPGIVFAASLAPFLGFIPCLFVMVKGKTPELLDDEKGSSVFEESAHWPSPEQDVTPVSSLTTTI